MVRRSRPPDDADWEDWFDSDTEPDPQASANHTDEEDLDDVLASERGVTEDSTEISMEVDEDGREVWYAEDPRIPGSSSLGNSLEEAMEGMEERRRAYREILDRAREPAERDQSGDISWKELDKQRKKYRETLRRSRERKRREE